MKGIVHYTTGRTFGTKVNARSYATVLKRVRPQKGGKSIRVTFDFDRPVAGRGYGPGQGLVKSVEFTLPTKTADALARALQLALAETASGSVQFTIKET